VLWAAQGVIDDGLATPILIGRRWRIEQRIAELGLRIRPDQDFEVIDPQNNPHYEECWQEYHRLRGRYGVDPNKARVRVNTRATVIGALLLRLGYGDALLCGLIGNYPDHVEYVLDIIGLREGVQTPAAMNMLITAQGPLFFCDTDINAEPTRRGNRRYHPAGGRGSGPLRAAESRAAVPFQLWLAQIAASPQDGGGPATDPPARARSGSGRRNARRRCSIRGTCATAHSCIHG
jgi:hypothetical protein